MLRQRRRALRYSYRLKYLSAVRQQYYFLSHREKARQQQRQIDRDHAMSRSAAARIYRRPGGLTLLQRAGAHADLPRADLSIVVSVALRYSVVRELRNSKTAAMTRTRSTVLCTY